MTTYRPLGLLILSLVLASLLAGCGSSGSATTQPPAYSSDVTPLAGADAQNVSSIKAADGSTPCGAFDVNGFGFKTVDLKAYPGCTATAYTVMCLNDKAQWIADNVSDVKQNGTSLTFTSRQEGTCGLFPSK